MFGSGALLFANAFVPWWFRLETTRRTYWHGAGLTRLGVAAALIGFVVAIAVIVRAARYPDRGPADGSAYVALGLGALAAVGVDLATTSGAWAGAWVGAALGALIALGGLIRRRERRRGWL